MKLETRADEIILLMESDLAGDYSDELSKGNWMRHFSSSLSRNFNYKISHGIVSEHIKKTPEKSGHRVSRLIREMGAGFLMAEGQTYNCVKC